MCTAANKEECGPRHQTQLQCHQTASLLLRPTMRPSTRSRGRRFLKKCTRDAGERAACTGLFVYLFGFVFVCWLVGCLVFCLLVCVHLFVAFSRAGPSRLIGVPLACGLTGFCTGLILLCLGIVCFAR